MGPFAECLPQITESTVNGLRETNHRPLDVLFNIGHQLSAARRCHSHTIHAPPVSQSRDAPLQRHESYHAECAAQHTRHRAALRWSGHQARSVQHRCTQHSGHIWVGAARGIPARHAGRDGRGGLRLCADNRIRWRHEQPHCRPVQ